VFNRSMPGSDKYQINWLVRSVDQSVEDRQCDDRSRDGIELTDTDDMVVTHRD
jgi:hypothetical protein